MLYKICIKFKRVSIILQENYKTLWMNLNICHFLYDVRKYQEICKRKSISIICIGKIKINSNFLSDITVLYGDGCYIIQSSR